MKTYSLVIVLIAVMLYTGCTDRLAGPDLDTQKESIPSWESAASKNASGQVADLSLKMRVDNATPGYNDSLLYIVSIHNEGPDQTSGVEVSAFPPDSLALVVLGASTSTQGACNTCGYNDSLGVWIVGPMPSGATEQLFIAARVVGTGRITSTAEIIASDARDPDSVPGDGDPRQDDQASVTIKVRRGR